MTIGLHFQGAVFLPNRIDLNKKITVRANEWPNKKNGQIKEIAKLTVNGHFKIFAIRRLGF